MNRWSEWARRLRSRHGRVEARRSAAAMVFHRPAWARGSLTVHAAARIHLHVHAPMGVALRPAAPPAVMVHVQGAQPAPVSAAATLRPPSPSQLPARLARIGRPPVPQAMFPAKFIHARTAATIRASAVERWWQPVRELAAAWLRKPPASLAAEALPLRLRQHAARTERPTAELPRMIAPARRDAAREASGMPARNGQSMAPWPPVPQSQQPAPAPAINLDSLTSQVMQQIDRRLVAWRERMGRV